MRVTAGKEYLYHPNLLDTIDGHTFGGRTFGQSRVFCALFSFRWHRLCHKMNSVVKQ